MYIPSNVIDEYLKFKDSSESLEEFKNHFKKVLSGHFDKFNPSRNPALNGYLALQHAIPELLSFSYAAIQVMGEKLTGEIGECEQLKAKNLEETYEYILCLLNDLHEIACEDGI